MGKVGLTSVFMTLNGFKDDPDNEKHNVNYNDFTPFKLQDFARGLFPKSSSTDETDFFEDWSRNNDKLSTGEAFYALQTIDADKKANGHVDFIQRGVFDTYLTLSQEDGDISGDEMRYLVSALLPPEAKWTEIIGNTATRLSNGDLFNKDSIKDDLETNSTSETDKNEISRSEILGYSLLGSNIADAFLGRYNYKTPDQLTENDFKTFLGVTTLPAGAFGTIIENLNDILNNAVDNGSQFGYLIALFEAIDKYNSNNGGADVTFNFRNADDTIRKITYSRIGNPPENG